MTRDIFQAVRDACLWLPEAEEFVSHGFPHFRVRGKTFASYVVNHHGDGRIALWLNAGAGMQDACVRFEPEQFFVPPYVGPRGWLGVQLDKGLAWQRIATLVRDAYEKVAPRILTKTLGETPAIEEPSSAPAASALDPWRSARGQGAARHPANDLSELSRNARSASIRISGLASRSEDLCLGPKRRTSADSLFLGRRRSAAATHRRCPLSYPSLPGTQRVDRTRCDHRRRSGRNRPNGPRELSTLRPEAHVAEAFGRLRACERCGRVTRLTGSPAKLSRPVEVE